MLSWTRWKLQYRDNIKLLSTVTNNEMSDEQQIVHYNQSVKYQATVFPQSYSHLRKLADSKIVSQHLSANLTQQDHWQRNTASSVNVSNALIQ